MTKRWAALLAPSAAAGAMAAVAAPVLLPISDTDMAQLPRSACRTWFASQRGDRLVLLSANGLAVRVGAARAGLCRCPLTPAQVDDFGSDAGSASCGGARLTLTRTGAPIAAPPGRPTGTDATLTAERGGRRTVLTGRAETECRSGSDEP